MATNEAVRYDRRALNDWVQSAQSGEMAITDFQRSFVWDPGRSAAYIKAILMGKPVGLYLILTTSEEPQFVPRPFYQMKAPMKHVQELVLDGQQRLTSLLHALDGQQRCKFFIKVKDLSADALEVEDVIYEIKNPQTGRLRQGHEDPATAYGENLIPIDILRKPPPSAKKLTPLAMWCTKVGDHVEGMAHNQARLLEDRIFDFVNRCFFQRSLWCCLLPETTKADEATEIFIETNTSSMKIKSFDIVVASVRGSHNEDIRKKIQDKYKTSPILRHYFSDDPEIYIPDIGEWMLKVACLHAGKAPKESRYREVASAMLEKRMRPEAKERKRQLDNLFKDLDWGLTQAEKYGAATKKLVPSWPSIYVLAALRAKFQGIRNPAEVDKARRLLDAYYWRCQFSNRYDARANDRLHEDFTQLVKALDRSAKQSCCLKVFDDRDYPLFDSDQLLKNAGWISSSRLGRGLASVVLASNPEPLDWMTGQPLTIALVRQLEDEQDLDRHHVFPRDVLRKAGVDGKLVQNGLNGVVLDRRTNLRLWKKSPDNYVSEMLSDLKIQEDEMQERIEGHHVPFAEMKSSKGTVEQRYHKFLKKRADKLSELVQKLGALPPG